MGIFDIGYPMVSRKPAFQIDPLMGADFSTDAQSNAMAYMAANPSAGQGGIPGTGPSFLDSFLGYKNADGTAVNGWGNMALGSLQGLGNAYMGMQQYGLAKDQFKFQKQAFDKNYQMQLGAVKGRIADQSAARYAANPGATGARSADDYTAAQLAKYGIK
jgi:hypothetical protein